MVGGILDTKDGSHVPGTQSLQHREAAQALRRFPVPSSSEKDPLNWPLARKNWLLAILCAQSIMAAALNPILSTNSIALLLEFKIGKFQDVALLTGYNVLALALAAPFWSASCRLYGRRHTFLLGSLLMVAGSFWGAKANSYHSLLGSRILQGIGAAPFEGLILVSVADLYFIEQRGRAYAVVAASYLLGVTITPIITGKLIADHGRRLPFYLIGGVSAVFTILIFLFLEETAFDRTDVNTTTNVPQTFVRNQAERKNPSDTEMSSQDKDGMFVNTTDPSQETVVTSDIPTFAIARLSPFSGRYSRDSPIKLLCRPVILCAHPAIFWGAATTGLIIAWVVMLATVIATFAAARPYGFGPTKTGYLYVGPFLGALISFPIAGFLSDYLARRMTKRYGVYEPEYRILLALPFTILALVGLYPFGSTFYNGFAVPASLFGFVIAGVVFSQVLVSTYFADAYPQLSVDAFIATLLVRNLLAYALTVKGFTWIFQAGIKRVFVLAGAGQTAVCLLAIPMYLFGKVIRQWSARSAGWQWLFR